MNEAKRNKEAGDEGANLTVLLADDRPVFEECDECGEKSNLYHKDEVDDEMMDALHKEGWNYSEGVMYCDDCSHRCRRT